MVVSTMPHSTTGGSDSQATTIKQPSGTVPHLCCLVDDLVKRREDVICKLDLCDRCRSRGSCADAESDNALFGQRSVEDTAATEARGESRGAAEDAAKRDVLSENQGAVFEVLMREGRGFVVDGLLFSVSRVANVLLSLGRAVFFLACEVAGEEREREREEAFFFFRGRKNEVFFSSVARGQIKSFLPFVRGQRRGHGFVDRGAHVDGPFRVQ